MRFPLAIVVFAVGCLGTGLRPLNLDTGATDTDTQPGTGGEPGYDGDADSDADSDADGDADSDADTDTGACNWPSASVAATAPGGGTMIPVYVSLDLFGVVEAGENFRDYHSDLAGEDIPALAAFGFYDINILNVCTVWYNATLTSTAPWASTGTINEAFVVNTPAGTGQSDVNCRGVNAGTFGSTDIRDWIESESWGIGIGQVTADNLPPLQNIAGLLGEDFATDWVPYVYGTYIWRGGSSAAEVGYGFRYEHTCGVVSETAGGVLTKLPTPSSGDVDGHHQTAVLYVVNVDN